MRLSISGTARTGAIVLIQFDDRPVEALEGETVAASLSAAGILGFRRTIGGAPRGLHCGMGACYDCVETMEGGVGQRAGVTAGRAGMVVRPNPPASPAPFRAEP